MRTRLFILFLFVFATTIWSQAQTDATKTSHSSAPIGLSAQDGALNANERQSPSGNDGIAMSLAQCATHSYACMIQAPALYAQTEAQPFGGAPNNYYPPISTGPTSSQPIAGVLDLRYGAPQWMFSGTQLWSDLRHSAQPTFAMHNITGSGPGTFAHYASALGLQTSAFAGGRNFYNDKSEFENLSIQTYKYTQAQGGGDIAQSVYCIGNGDCAGHTINTISYGGPNTASDEGNESMRFEAIEGGQVFGANLASITTASDGSVTFTTTAQTYNGFQGEGRLLIDLSKAYNGAANSNYIASISAVNNDEVVACGGNCNWDSVFGDSTHTKLTAAVGNSTVHAATITSVSQTGSVATFTSANSFTAGQTARFVGGTLNGHYFTVLSAGLSATQFSVATSTVIGTNPTSASVPSYINTFPQSPAAGVTLAVASSANFTVGNLACIFDYDYECEKITAVGTGTVTIATDRLPHPVGAYVTTGGLAGSSIEFETDRVVPGNTNGISTLPDVGLVSTVRNAIPIMYNSSGNTLAFFQGGNTLPGTSGSYTGRAYKSAPGSGGAVTLTVAGNVVTSVSCTGGTGYIASIPLQVTATYGAGGGTAPTVYTRTTGSDGALSTCGFTSGRNLATATSNALPSNPYDIYPTTKVTSVYDAAAGSVDGTFYTEPLINTVGTWAVSDLVEEPHYFYQHIRGSDNVVGAYIPSLGASANAGLGYTLDGLWKGSDIALSIANNTNPTVYAGYPLGTPWVPGLGQVFAPYGLRLHGPFNTGLFMNTPPYGNYGAAVQVNCGSLGCKNWTNPYKVMGVQGWNGTADVIDGLSYNPSTRAWVLSGSSFSLRTVDGRTVPIVSSAQDTGNYAARKSGQPEAIGNGANLTSHGMTTGTVICQSTAVGTNTCSVPYTLPYSITITGFNLLLATPASGCATYPNLSFYDQTTGASLISLSPKSSTQGPFSASGGPWKTTAGHTYNVRWTVAARECATNLSGAYYSLVW